MTELQVSFAVVALVAAIRRQAPRVDGTVVLVLAVVLGVLVALAIAHEQGRSLLSGAVSGAISALAAVGGMTAIDRVANRDTKPVNTEVSDAPR